MGDPLPVPEDQRHLPRASRQFPYRWLDAAEREEVRAEADQILSGLKRLIAKMVDDYAPRGFMHEDAEDVRQEIALKIYTDCLPKFDAWRGVKVSTFAYRFIYWYARGYADRHRRRPRPGLIEHADQILAPDTSHDRRVESLAASLLSDPSPLGRHADAILAKPADVPDADIASRLGITKHTLSLARMDARKRAVAILDAA